MTTKSPIILSIGLFIILSLSACQSPKTPEQTAMAFWSAMTTADLERAKQYCNDQSISLLSTPLPDKLKNAAFKYGKIVIDGNEATVSTQLVQSEKPTTAFNTFLVKEKNHWKVDYQRTLQSLSAAPFNDLVNSLDKLGEQLSEEFNKQIEQQIPLIEKEIQSFGDKLKQQLDKFGKELNKTLPQKEPTDPYKDSV